MAYLFFVRRMRASTFLGQLSARHRPLFYFVVIIVTGTVGCFLPGLQNLANGSTTLITEHEVRAVADEIIAADNVRDLNAVLRLYEVDAVLLPPNEPAVVGRDAIRPRYEALFQSMTPAIVSKIDEVQVAGDWAFVRGNNAGEMRPLIGHSSPPKLDDVFLMILHRGQDGRWRIARLMWHASSVPPK
jgi:uncharacterized protein (TIGR02246 family)